MAFANFLHFDLNHYSKLTHSLRPGPMPVAGLPPVLSGPLPLPPVNAPPAGLLPPPLPLPEQRGADGILNQEEFYAIQKELRKYVNTYSSD